MQFFPSTRYLDYAVRVETTTLQKSANLVRNAWAYDTVMCKVMEMMCYGQ